MIKLNFILSLLFPILVIGQIKTKKVDVIWGNPVNVKKIGFFKDFIGRDKTGYYILNEKDGVYSDFQHYDESMNLVNSFQTKLKYKYDEVKYQSSLLSGDTIYWFYSYLDNKRKKNILYLQPINKASLEPYENSKRIISKINFEKDILVELGRYGIKISPDKSKIMIYSNSKTEEYGDKQFDIKVYNNNLKLLWERKAQLKHSTRDLWDYVVDNDGNVALLDVYHENKPKQKGDEPTDFGNKILYFYNSGTEIKEYTIKEKCSYSFEIGFDGQSNIVCSGISFNDYCSILYKIDHNSKEIVVESFDSKHIDNSKKEADKEGKAYSLKRAYFKKDGSVVWVGEGFGYGNSFQSENNIYIYYISPDGNIEWDTKIIKRQVNINSLENWESYTLILNNDNIYLIYNDNAENILNNSYIKVLSSMNQANTILLEISDNGDQQKEVLFSKEDIKNDKVLINPKNCYQISDDKVVILGRKSSTQRLGLIRFRD